MARKRKLTIEAKSVDEAWYPCSLKFKGNQVIIHFLGYGSDADESWDLDTFSTADDVLNRVRVTSEQLQDKECTKVRVSTTVCALKEMENEKKYFDAVVRRIIKRKHKQNANGGTECKCSFKVEWAGGSAKGKAEEIYCSAITTMCDRDPLEHPELQSFLDKVASRDSAQEKKTQKRKAAYKERRAAQSKKRRAVSKELPEVLVTEGKKPESVMMTEREICSTINEVCDAYQPNKSDADFIHSVTGVEVEASKDKKAGKLWLATMHNEVLQDSLPKDQRFIELEPSEASGSDKTVSVTELSSDDDSSKRKLNGGATGRETATTNKYSSKLGGSSGPGNVADLNGNATPLSAEKEATAAHEVIPISDDEQGSCKVCNLNGVRGSPKLQLVQASAEMEKICSGQWPISCTLRIDNVEKDLCPRRAATFLSSTMEKLISVFLFPAGRDQTSTYGFVMFKDSQAAEKALILVTKKYIVASHHHRPWSVTQAKDSMEERALIMLLARGNWQPDIEPSVATSSRVSSQQSGQLTWILPEMKEYTVVKELQKLHIAHRKRFQKLWKSIDRDEVATKLRGLIYVEHV
eukprot:TRINITY_DN2008_c0_g1_i1.p1 TRINITY_DN2008_c0_g1~~TRINITY_DN2008_c0_g1_i1.p1  ORF type:complete len:579 (-),score=102.96 TRINITY_DN2008_c0_g1_i1:366-2102(-)